MHLETVVVSPFPFVTALRGIGKAALFTGYKVVFLSEATAEFQLKSNLNKAMLGHVAPNLNLSVSVSSLSSPIHPSLVVP